MTSLRVGFGEKIHDQDHRQKDSTADTEIPRRLRRLSLGFLSMRTRLPAQTMNDVSIFDQQMHTSMRKLSRPRRFRRSSSGSMPLRSSSCSINRDSSLAIDALRSSETIIGLRTTRHVLLIYYQSYGARAKFTRRFSRRYLGQQSCDRLLRSRNRRRDLH